MASTDALRLRLVDAIARAAARLAKASVWNRTGFPVSGQDDFVYEMYVLLRLVLALTATHDVAYVAGAGVAAHAFPKKPAKKAGRPRFSVRSRAGARAAAPPNEIQLCAGTQVKDIHADLRAPDISLQRGLAGDDPGPADVLAIIDAKFRAEGGRITSHEFSEFARWIEVLGLRPSLSGPPPFGIPRLPELEGNCLVTNGIESSECDAERHRVNLSEVVEFAPSRAHRRCP